MARLKIPFAYDMTEREARAQLEARGLNPEDFELVRAPEPPPLNHLSPEERWGEPLGLGRPLIDVDSGTGVFDAAAKAAFTKAVLRKAARIVEALRVPDDMPNAGGWFVGMMDAALALRRAAQGEEMPEAPEELLPKGVLAQYLDSAKVYWEGRLAKAQARQIDKAEIAKRLLDGTWVGNADLTSAAQIEQEILKCGIWLASIAKTRLDLVGSAAAEGDADAEDGRRGG